MNSRKVFTKVTVTPDFVNGHFVQWDVDPFFAGKRPYNFCLQISQTLDFTKLIASKDNLGETFFAVDDTGLKQSWTNNYIYRVILTTADGQTYESTPLYFGASRSNTRSYTMASEIIRREFLFCRVAGYTGWLLKRKTYGTSTRSSKNLDPVSGVPIADDKLEDLGVGLDGGYFDPVSCAYIVEDQSQDKQISPDGNGVKETFDIRGRIPGYPPVGVRDVICNSMDGSRYSVMASTTTLFPGSGIPLTQKVTLRLIPPSDTIYSIKIPHNATGE